MSKSRIKVFVLYFSIFAQLLAGVGSLEGMVLCLEASGNVAVEFSRNGTCCSSSTVNFFSRSSSLSLNLSDNSNCGVCLDIPILLVATQRPFVSTKALLAQLKPVFLPINLFPIDALPEILNEDNYLQYLSPSKNTLLLQRTPLLLI